FIARINFLKLELRLPIIFARVVDGPYDIPYRTGCTKCPLGIECDASLAIVGQVPNTADKTFGRSFLKNSFHAIGRREILFVYRMQYPLSFYTLTPRGCGGRACCCPLLGPA